EGGIPHQIPSRFEIDVDRAWNHARHVEVGVVGHGASAWVCWWISEKDWSFDSDRGFVIIEV
ncbi:MAG: hypothetical protein ACE5IO_07855, partial [Thermoplasmata archaeon]